MEVSTGAINFKFCDTCTACVKIVEILSREKGIYKLETKVVNQNGVTVSDGYAVVKYKQS